MEKDCICIPDSALIYVQIVDCDAAIKWNTFVEPSGDAAITCPDDVGISHGFNCSHSNYRIYILGCSMLWRSRNSRPSTESTSIRPI